MSSKPLLAISLLNGSFSHIFSLVAQMVKNLPAMPETWVRSQDWEDPLEEGMATHSSIPAWRIPRDRGAWCAAVHGVAESWTQLSAYALHSTASERE